ncbi:MAG: polymer-forming cytoskeletal protein [Candidatus Zixiibacteriota bacterium]
MIIPKKVSFFLIPFLLWLILLPLVTSSATVFKARDNVFIPEHQIIDDDLFLGGNNIKVDGTVKGDLIVGSRTLIQTGKVSGSVMSVGQNLDILGEIEGSVRAFSQNTNINGIINRNVINFGASLNIRHNGKVKGDVTALGNELAVEGEIGRKLRATVGSVVISGTINGDVKIKANSITLMPTARINGNFEYKSEKEAKIEPGAQITGETQWIKIDAEEKKKKEFLTTSSVVLKSLLFLACIVTGVFLIIISRNYVQAAQKNVFESFLKSLGLGFILMICIPIAIIVLLATVIGIPLALITLFVYLVLFYISKIFVGIAVGNKILTGFAKDKEAPLGWSLILGLILLTILTNIPYVGILIYIIIVFTGFGAAILARKVLVS